MYSNKDKKFITQELIKLLDDERVTMASIPGKNGKSVLWLVREDVFQDIRIENDQMRKWIFELGKYLTENLTVYSPTLGETIRNIFLLLGDAGVRFLGWDQKMEINKEESNG